MPNNQSTDTHANALDSDEGGFLGVVARSRSYLNIIYLLLSFPLGIFYFVFLIVGLALGFGLSVLGIGLVILFFMFVAMRYLAAVERQLGIWLLGAEIPRPAPAQASLQHPLQAFKEYLTDSYTWKSFAYLMVKFPFAILAFVVVVTLGSVTAALVFAPLMYPYAPIHIGMWRISNAQGALLCLAVGLVVGVASLHVVNLLAAGWRAFSVWMLAGYKARGSELSSGPVVIP